MWVEFVIGATLLAVVLSMQREHMATGIYTKTTPPTDEESSEIFDQVMAMAPAILHDAYADALAFAQRALTDAKSYAAKVPSDRGLQGVALTSADKVVQYSKNAVAFAVINGGRVASGQQTAPTEPQLKALVDKLYTQLNQHIDDKLPPVVPSPNETPIQTEMNAKAREYAEEARALVKKYDTPEVRDACLLVLKEYYVDQLKPGWTAAPPAKQQVAAVDPTAAGNMSELEAEYQSRKIVYDNLVATSLANNDSSKIDAIAAAKQAMNETLNKMLALSAKSGTDEQQEELVRRIMEIQRDYNGLLVSTDKLHTLRLIHQTMDVRTNTGLKIFGVLFVIAAIVLVVMVIRTR